MFAFISGFRVYTKKLTLGHLYVSRNEIVKFIQVTRKGFNLLNIKTNKCILRGHAYCPKWSRKDIPENVKEFTVTLPEYITLNEIHNSNK